MARGIGRRAHVLCPRWVPGHPQPRTVCIAEPPDSTPRRRQWRASHQLPTPRSRSVPGHGASAYPALVRTRRRCVLCASGRASRCSRDEVGRGPRPCSSPGRAPSASLRNTLRSSWAGTAGRFPAGSRRQDPTCDLISVQHFGPERDRPITGPSRRSVSRGWPVSNYLGLGCRERRRNAWSFESSQMARWRSDPGWCGTIPTCSMRLGWRCRSPSPRCASPFALRCWSTTRRWGSWPTCAPRRGAVADPPGNRRRSRCRRPGCLCAACVGSADTYGRRSLANGDGVATG